LKFVSLPERAAARVICLHADAAELPAPSANFSMRDYNLPGPSSTVTLRIVFIDLQPHCRITY
jgi:hypothetical protein